jgi:hypothetical protein
MHLAYAATKHTPHPSSDGHQLLFYGGHPAERARHLSVRYQRLQERLRSLHSAPLKNMQAIDGVIALLARTQQHLQALGATGIRH